MGASPRGSRGLYRAAKVWAAMEGRDYVTPDDVQYLAVPVLSHRLLLTGQARFSGKSAESVVRRSSPVWRCRPGLRRCSVDDKLFIGARSSLLVSNGALALYAMLAVLSAVFHVTSLCAGSGIFAVFLRGVPPVGRKCAA